MGTTFSNVSMKEVAQRRSISCQESSRFILVRRCRSWKCPEAKTERGRRNRVRLAVWARHGGRAPREAGTWKGGDGPALGSPPCGDEPEPTQHGNRTETPCAVQFKLNSC